MEGFVKNKKTTYRRCELATRLKPRPIGISILKIVSIGTSFTFLLNSITCYYNENQTSLDWHFVGHIFIVSFKHSLDQDLFPVLLTCFLMTRFSQSMIVLLTCFLMTKLFQIMIESNAMFKNVLPMVRTCRTVVVCASDYDDRTQFSMFERTCINIPFKKQVDFQQYIWPEKL